MSTFVFPADEKIRVVLIDEISPQPKLLLYGEFESRSANQFIAVIRKVAFCIYHSKKFIIFFKVTTTYRGRE